MGLDNSISSVMRAAADAYAKHGPLTADPVRACAIMIREAGEALNEALLATRTPDVMANESAEPVITNAVEKVRQLHISRLYDELAQVAATCMIIMEEIEGGWVAHE